MNFIEETVGDIMPRIDVVQQSIQDIVRLSVIDCITAMNNLSSQFEIVIKKEGTESIPKEVTVGEVIAVPEEVNVGEVIAVPALAVAAGSATGVGGMVPKKEIRTKRIPLDLDDIKSTIFSCGITENDAVAIVSHVLNLKPWSNQMARTKIKNFMRAVVHLVVYIHYQNVVEDVVCLQYVGRGVGYMNLFEIMKPIKNNAEYMELVRKVMNKALSSDSVSRCVWHPSHDDMEKWSGNMKSYFFSSLKGSFQIGLFTRDQTPLEGGLFSEWYELLKSLGISYNL